MAADTPPPDIVPSDNTSSPTLDPHQVPTQDAVAPATDELGSPPDKQPSLPTDPSETRMGFELRKARLEYFGSLVGLVIAGVTLAVTIAGFTASSDETSAPPDEDDWNSRYAVREPRVVVEGSEYPAVVHHVHHYPYFERLITHLLLSETLRANGTVPNDITVPRSDPLPETWKRVREAPWPGDVRVNGTMGSARRNSEVAPQKKTPVWQFALAGAAFGLMLWSLGVMFRRR